MGIAGSIIETGVDKLVKLVNTKGRIAASDAAKELGVGMSVIMEWADFLEEEGIINIEYKFTKPYLVARKIAKKDVQEKAKEFSGKKEVFIRKAEVSLSFINRESNKLKTLKEEFDKIKRDLGFDIGNIKNELQELTKYEQLKIDLDKQMEDQKRSSVDKLQEITKQVLREKKKYQYILTEIKKEEEVLERDKVEANSIEESQKLIKDRLNSLKKIIEKVENRVTTEEESVKISENSIQKLVAMAENLKVRVEEEKGLIEPLVEQSTSQAEKIKELQAAIIKKIESKEKKLKGAKSASKKMKEFFKKKLGVMSFIEKVNKDTNDLQNELIALIKKARSFQLSSSSANLGSQIEGLEKKFKEVDTKKNLFERELKKINTFFR
ncbi:MAG: hypothetical protein IH934_01015 [Nanoarchaeota archaeon]|nr:hypothetical protein [Nanoarchaeota archaeon]